MNFSTNTLEQAKEGDPATPQYEPTKGWYGVLTSLVSRPQIAYKNPLQRVEDALRMQQVGFAHSTSIQEIGSDANMEAPPVIASSSQKTSPPSSAVNRSPVCEFPNYSYRFLLGVHSESFRNGSSSSGSRQEECSLKGTVSGPEPRAGKQITQNGGYYLGPSLLSLFSNPRTRADRFKPQKVGRGTSSWQLKQYAEATLGSGSLRKAVKLPEGEDKDEWLAVNGQGSILSAKPELISGSC